MIRKIGLPPFGQLHLRANPEAQTVKMSIVTALLTKEIELSVDQAEAISVALELCIEDARCDTESA